MVSTFLNKVLRDGVSGFYVLDKGKKRRAREVIGASCNPLSFQTFFPRL